jgi:peptidoglycan L-alanyl-D-glutamate endopeptidase CwlK
MEILRRNSEGIEVANWQRFLISQGYKIEADGDFGKATEHATQQWQLSVGLIADGEVGTNSFAMAEKVKGSVNIGSQKPTQEPMPPPSMINNPRLKKVHPKLAEKAQRIIDLAKADGIELLVTQGLRTFAEQDALFKKRPKVTNARGGQSMHNYGLAVDFAVMVNGKISWDEKLYKPIGKYADTVGLEWGGNWRFRDLPHVQLKGLPSYKVLLPIYQQKGLKAVWEKYQG